MGSQARNPFQVVGYHITTSAALPKILTQGLKTSIGPRSKLLGEFVPAIHFYGNLDAVKKGLNSWIGDIFNPSEKLFVVECNLDCEKTVRNRNNGEIVSFNDIGTQCIRNVMDADMSQFKRIQTPRILTSAPASMSPLARKSIQRDLFA